MKFLLLGIAGCCAVCTPAFAQSQAPTMAGRSEVFAPNGAAATSQPLATTAAVTVLQQGGNAIDAAVAAAAVLSVTEPMMTGIGGDMFALVWSAKDHRLFALNASGRAGALMTRETLLARGYSQMPEHGGELVTVPGALAGWQTLLSRFGTRSLAQVLEPAIGYAENGFPVTPVIARGWTGSFGSAADLARDPGFKATFLLGGSRAPEAGDWFRNPDYARTLRQIAREGTAAFYTGSIGRKIVASVREHGGFLTEADLAQNQPTWEMPISIHFHGYRIWELPPNNVGVAALEILRLLEPYDLPALGSNSAPYLHLILEAKKLAYADLARYDGDAGHLVITPEYLLSDRYIAERRRQIDPAKAHFPVQPGPQRMKSDTVYLTVADREGNMVSFINSLYDEWGAQLVVPGLGFALHDRGNAFTLAPGLPNTVAPGKRPLHTLIPGFVTRPAKAERADGFGDEPYMSFGIMGGTFQAQGHPQFLINLFVFNQSLQAAMDTGRVRNVDGQHTLIERVIPESVRAQLRALGHDLAVGPSASFGGSQAIIKLAHGYEAASDPRKDGQAAGY